MPSETNFVSFRFVGPDVHPALITARLGINPSRAHEKGEPMPRRPAHAYPTGAWCIDSPLPASQPFETQISALLDRLALVSTGIQNLASSGLIGEFYCSYFIEGTQGTVDLSSSTLARIGALPARLLIAIYCEESDIDE